MMKKGFTLIELSIVLVVIGLITAGVLLGRDLIRAAELRKQITQIESFDVAVNTFRLKYNCLPGDCPNGTNFGFTVNGNGNGNGIISGSSFVNLNNWYERASLWRTLFDARLIPEVWRFCSEINCEPPLKLSSESSVGPYLPDIAPTGAMVVSNSSEYIFTRTGGTHYYWLSQCSADIGNTETTCAIYTPQTSFELDSKMDDGLPLSGKVVARGTVAAGIAGDPSTSGPTDAVPGAGGATANVCVSNSVTPNIYNTVNTSRDQASLCSLTVQAPY